MSLAARCTACGTAFRVVQDQLRVSDGWVRCGRCNAVFNANETLFDPHAPATPPATEPPTEAVAAPAFGEPPDLAKPDADVTLNVDALHAALFERGPAEPASRPELADDVEALADVEAAPTVGELAGPGLERATSGPLADERPDVPVAVAVAEPGTVAQPVPSADVADTADARAPTAGADEPAGAAPGFLREAERAARWRSPEMRALLGGAAVLLAGAALIQGARGLHEPIVSQWPQARAWLEPLCRVAGCEVQARRRLDALSVDGSSLVRTDDGERARLTLVLRNRDRHELLLPAVELTLTDAQGAIVARKVLATAELGAAGPVIGAGAELTLHGVLDTGDLRVVGYTIELFYP